MPGDLAGEDIPLAVRLMQVAQDADLAVARGGPELARTVLAGRAGSGLDPAAVAAFLELGDKVYAGLGDVPSVWDEVLAAEPGPRPVITEDRLDDCLSAVADFADLGAAGPQGAPFLIGPGRPASRQIARAVPGPRRSPRFRGSGGISPERPDRPKRQSELNV